MHRVFQPTRGSIHYYRKNSDLEVIKQHLSQLNHKIYHLTGNHDYEGVTSNSVLYKQLDMPSEYYSFKKGDWIFIMLNTNEIASYANIAGTPKEDARTDKTNQRQICL